MKKCPKVSRVNFDPFSLFLSLVHPQRYTKDAKPFLAKEVYISCAHYPPPLPRRNPIGIGFLTRHQVKLSLQYYFLIFLSLNQGLLPGTQQAADFSSRKKKLCLTIQAQLCHFWFDHATYGVIGRFSMQISKPIQVQRVEFQERVGIIRPLVDRLARVLLTICVNS